MKRKLLKSLTWRVIASLTTLTIVYIISGEIKIAGLITIMESVFKMIIYYLHETVWEKIELNKEDNV
ncbi:Uncharacterized membrane protein [Paramaledivibacter caminithermalis DSM 15212]|uniref:Uncharacterized membrane protein n=1 Tax=Paramaledivibacter caminithermalis (strain DSM 15212 / CIP 107654 / DViRD3) TaxID=1121301 RepID=A0A1M6JU50_PARC5|nr:Uncharacterized membrane protein [Paramaledivibacter caminithermalis DSM 15212]